ncbi:N-acetylmuramoyl-L-alanine amidase [Lysobacteraceae bacterium NML120232]|nr:N-acetylmuramoyl-L-alanine amidase [Xanthomonadaceae bacterium NML08-0793]PJK12428.1 N-acetylmuramoyl-L-alanine amidase [Xanthomonadaceae bacterium NML120232]
MNIKPLVALALTAALAACTHAPLRNPKASWVPSPNQDARRALVIVLHYTQQDSVEESLETLRTANSQGKVSAHYLLGKDGRLYQLVADEARAWHAGGGRWGTITDLNSASIGIEIDNNGVAPYPDVQIEALIALLEDLTTRLRIPKTQIIGHSDLAPTRKVDPGAHFPWKRLHDAGFGIWPSGELVDAPAGFDPWLAMAALGYPLADRPAALRAFRMRFRAIPATQTQPAEPDAEDLRILYALSRNLVQ